MPLRGHVSRFAVLAGLAAVVLMLAGGLSALATTPTTADAGNGVITDPATISKLRTEALDGTLAATHGTAPTCAHFCRSDYVTADKNTSTPLLSSFPIGLGAKTLEKAYGLTGAPSGQRRIAIIGISPYPKLESDLNVYRSQYGLGACTQANGCLSIHSYTGGQPLPARTSNHGFQRETAIDVQMVSAACPKCKITVLEVPTSLASTFTNPALIHAFSIGTQTAVRLGASDVSISYGIPTSSEIDHGPDSKRLVQPGVGIFVAGGDAGFQTPRQFQGYSGGWPHNLRSIVSVGGTQLRRNLLSPTGFNQIVWNEGDPAFGITGSGCSPDLGPATGQPAGIAASCNGKRATNDISAVADNVAVYYTNYAHPKQNGWWNTGGTSAASPFVAGIAARAPAISDEVGPNAIYRAPASAFGDVTRGESGSAGQCAHQHYAARVCVAAPGWDGPSGRGTPIGLAPFTAH